MIRIIDAAFGRLLVPDTDPWQYGVVVRTGRSYDWQSIEAVRHALAGRPRGTMLDVGASFGIWSLSLAPEVDKIYAFEPQHNVARLLSANIEINNLPHKMWAFRQAIGDVETTVRVVRLDFSEKGNFGGVALGEKPTPDATPPYVIRGFDFVPMRPLDNDYWEDVAFIKIDVEGCEEKVLAGAERTIIEHRPLIFVEYDHPSTNRNALRERLTGYHYTISYDDGCNWLCVPT